MNNVIKTLIPAIVSILTLVLSHGLYAQDFSYVYEGHSVNYTIIDKDAKTCMTKEGYKKGPGDKDSEFVPGTKIEEIHCTITIPEVVEYEDETYTVVKIGYGSFSSNNLLKKIILPPTIKTIDKYAFSWCGGLESISMPDSLETIDEWAFSRCSSLININLPFNISYIGKYAFNKIPLKSIVIPNKIKKIEDYCFNECAALRDVIMPNSLISIGYSAFYGCNSLSSVYIPNSVEWISDNAFYGCNLETITLGKTLKGMGDNNLSWGSLGKIISLSDTPPFIGKNNFPDYTKVYIPKNSLNNYLSLWGKRDYIEIEPIEMSLDPSGLSLQVGEMMTVDFKTDVSDTIPFFWEIENFNRDKIQVTTCEDSKIAVTGLMPGYAIFRVSQREMVTGIEYLSYCYVTVTSQKAGIRPVVIDDSFDDSSVRYYNLNGVLMNPDNLPSGIYIRKYKGETKKILVK